MAVADSTADPDAYDGNAAYAYAKRGQVLLVDQWAKAEAAKTKDKQVTFVSVHPGW
jgi:NAD(P)-dependent dehydrogenase (short-subunit alcohol dehydrogenase family)